MDNRFERRKQVLLGAFDAVAQKGFDSVTLQDIADYAQVSKGVISYYFSNKEAVFCHLLEWLTEKIYKNEFIAISKNTTAIEKMRAYIDAVFVSPKENRKFFRVYLEFLAQASHNERYRKINEQFYKNCWSIGSEIIKLGQEEGTFAKVDIDNASYMMRSLVDGCLIQWLMRDNDELHEFYREKCFETIISYLTNQSYKSNR